MKTYWFFAILLLILCGCSVFLGCDCGDDDDPSTSSGQADDDDDDDDDDDNDDDDNNNVVEKRLYIFDDTAPFPWGGWMGEPDPGGGKQLDIMNPNAYEGVYAVRAYIDGSNLWDGIWVRVHDLWEGPGTDWRGASKLCYAIKAEPNETVKIIWMQDNQTLQDCASRYVTGDGEWHEFCEPLDECSGLESVQNVFGFSTNTGEQEIYFDEIYVVFLRPVETPAKVTIKTSAGPKYKLMVDGDPFFVKGFGQNWWDWQDSTFPIYPHMAADFDLVVAASGNTVRNWSVSNMTFQTLDLMHEKGLHLLAMLWMLRGEEADGMQIPDYTNPVYRQAVRRTALNFVECFKDHPAVLAWLFGNEVFHFMQPVEETTVEQNREGFAILLGEIAADVHGVDPNHPISTVGVCAEYLELVVDHAPSLDFWGSNAYECIKDVVNDATTAGWDGPILFTEFGPLGWWEYSGDWCNDYSDEEQAEDIRLHYENFIAGQCDVVLGGSAFAWYDKIDPDAPCYGWGMIEDDESRMPKPQYGVLAEVYSTPTPCE